MNTFTFTIAEQKSFAVRTAGTPEVPLFVAADVCAALELGNPTMALSRLDEDEHTLISIEGINSGPGNPYVKAVTYPGLLSLVLGSRKPEARAFKRWVTHEVLPAIQKTGSYSVALSPAQTILALAQLGVDHEQKIAALGAEQKRQALALEDVRLLAAEGRNLPTGYITIRGFANLHSLKLNCADRSKLGKATAHYCREHGISMGSSPDEQYGSTKTYPLEAVKIVATHQGLMLPDAA